MVTDNATPIDLAKFVFKKLKDAKISYPQPNEEVLNTLFENLFYTSIKTEEGQLIKVTVTLIDPDKPDPTPPKIIAADRWTFTHFKEKLPFTVKNLVKLSKAADPWSSSLAVYYDQNNKLTIWGMIDQSVHYQSFLNYEAETGPEQPGLFQASITGIGNIVVMFDYELIATLKQNILISNYIDVFRRGTISEIIQSNIEPETKKISSFVKKLFPEDESDWEGFVDHIVYESLSRILIRIQNYQHGGAFLITPTIKGLDIKYKMEYNRLFTSIINIAKYTISNWSYSQKIADEYLEEDEELMPVSLYLEESISEDDTNETKAELKGALRFISSLTCIDGLVVLSKELKVKGFGAIIRTTDLPDIIYSSKTATINPDKLIEINTNHFGTRHRSMFSYCWSTPKSIGFVVSQDGDIRAITRVNEKLIMWENIKVQQFIRSNKLKRPVLIKKKV